MAKKIKVVDYDSEGDILFISNEDNIKASIDIGDFVLDINHRNLVSGIEIMDASENLGISKRILGKIKNMKMSVNYKKDHVYVLLMISFKEKGKDVNVPIPLTLGLGHKTPKRDVLLYN